jgi:soluble lytic murein transglycosylase-like protein
MECLADGARRFGLPQAVILAVMDVEAGTVGRATINSDGSRDLGPMQINSLWLPRLRELGLGEGEVRDDGCVNLAVGAWILRGHLARTGSLGLAIASYHSRRPARGRRYLSAALGRLGRLSPRRILARANGGL